MQQILLVPTLIQIFDDNFDVSSQQVEVLSDLHPFAIQIFQHGNQYLSRTMALCRKKLSEACDVIGSALRKCAAFSEVRQVQHVQ